MEQENLPSQPTQTQPKSSLPIMIIVILIVLLTAGGIFYYSVSTKTDNTKEQNPTYEHNLEEPSPFMGGTLLGRYEYHIEHEGNLYSEDAISILSAERLTEEESLKMEDELPGVFCGMKTVYAKFSKYDKDVYNYDFCLTPLPKNGEELFSLVEKIKSYKEFIKVNAYIYFSKEDMGGVVQAD